MLSSGDEMSVLDKAVRLLREGRVKPEFRNGDVYYFKVYSKQVYDVRVDSRSTWCTCKYQIYRPDRLCSHVIACLLWLANQEKKDTIKSGVDAMLKGLKPWIRKGDKLICPYCQYEYKPKRRVPKQCPLCKRYIKFWVEPVSEDDVENV